MSKSSAEKNIDSGTLTDLVKEYDVIRNKIASLQTQEKEIKGKIEQESSLVRVKEENKGKYISLLRITSEDVHPYRVEFRQTNGALDISQKNTLNELFGNSRPLLFSKEKAVSAIIDPKKLIEDLESSGKNPWDYLDLKIKSNMDRVIADNSDAVTVQEAFLPKKGFVGTLNDIVHTLKDGAKRYIKKYMETALRPTVVAGTKGKA